jgi:hypothetical protein
LLVLGVGCMISVGWGRCEDATFVCGCTKPSPPQCRKTAPNTHVPSGKMSSGVAPVACTCCRMRCATKCRSLTSVRLNHRHPRLSRHLVCKKPTQPPWSCMMTAKAE